MRITSPAILALALATQTVLLPAQLATPTAVFTSPGSQANSPAAALTVSGFFQAPGRPPSPTTTYVSAGTAASVTVCHQSYGSSTFPLPGMWSLTGTVLGAANSPIAVAVEVVPGSYFCGGFAGTPCMTGPQLFASVPTAAGELHLSPNMTIILDGMWGGAPPAALDANGSYALMGSGTIDTVTNGGSEYHFAVQAAVADPTAPAGVTLTACLTASQWVFYL